MLGGLCGLLLSLLAGEPARRALFDSFQRAAPRAISTRHVAVVLIDPESLKAAGPWPWPRYYLARLTETITAQKPRAIGFDMIFAEPDRLNPRSFAALYPELDGGAVRALGALPSMDDIFAQVLARSPAVLGRLAIESDGTDPAQLLVDPQIAGRPPPGTPHFRQVLANIHALEDVALGHAMLNGPPDADGIVRRVPLTVLAGGRALPGLAAELARIASGAPQLAWDKGALVLDGRRLPADAAGQLQLRFGTFPRQASYSAARVLAGAVPRDAFTGRTVLIGLGAEGTADLVATPLATEGYGVFVQAQAVDAMLSGGWLSRPAWLGLAEWASGALLVVLVALAGGTGKRWPMALAPGLAVLLAGLSWLGFARLNLLFDPLRPAMMGAGGALALGAILLRRARSERSRLAAQLVEQRISSALQEGELQAARTIQLSMVPARGQLAGLDPRIDAGAVLKPARSVGGDFYDAIRIDADRLLFLIGDVTGKGVPAALYMALSKALTRSVLVREAGGLAHAAGTLNRELLRAADEAMGLSMLIVLLDCASGALVLVNAGHENPIIVAADGAARTLPMQGGPPFCVCDFAYPEEEHRLHPGDMLVLVTDGVTEAQDEAGRLFGLPAVVEALGRAGSGDANACVDHLAAAVSAFEDQAPASDDLTILAVRYLGAGDG